MASNCTSIASMQLTGKPAKAHRVRMLLNMEHQADERAWSS
jgi:hypothetical protein